MSAYIKFVTWNNKNGGKYGRFAEEYFPYGRIYKTIQIRQLYHKYRRLTANLGELECMAWDVMRNFFYIALIVKKINFRNSFHCRYKELIIFIIAYFLLHCLLYSVLRKYLMVKVLLTNRDVVIMGARGAMAPLL